MKKTAEEILESCRVIKPDHNGIKRALPFDEEQALEAIKIALKQSNPTPTEAEINEAALLYRQSQTGFVFEKEQGFISGIQWIQNYQTERREKSVASKEESTESWNKPINGVINVPDYLDPLINKFGFHYRIHRISKRTTEAEMVCNMVYAAEQFFNASQPNPAIAVINNKLTELRNRRQNGFDTSELEKEFKLVKETILKQIKP